MEFAIVSLAAGHEYGKAVSLATQSKERYCRMHGYAFVLEKEPLDASRPVAWSKIPLIAKVLPHYDYVFWSDADAMVVNYDIAFEDMFKCFFGTRTNMVVTKDAAGNINTGNFLLKNDEWSFELLEKIWNQEQFINHPWWENQAFLHLLHTDSLVKEHAAVVPYTDFTFNSYPHFPNGFKEGDFIVHFAGIHDVGELEKRIVKHFKIPKEADLVLSS